MMMTRMATVYYYCMERYYVTCAFWWQLGTCQARAFGEGVCVRHPLLLDVGKLPAGILIANTGLGHLDHMDDAFVLDTSNTWCRPETLEIYLHG